MRKEVLGLILIGSLGFPKDLMISFGDGGLQRYEVVDNVCYSFILKPKDVSKTPLALSQAVKRTLLDVKKKFSDKADAFINLRVFFTQVGDVILYQVCGDLVKEVE